MENLSSNRVHTTCAINVCFFHVWHCRVFAPIPPFFFRPQSYISASILFIGVLESEYSLKWCNNWYQYFVEYDLFLKQWVSTKIRGVLKSLNRDHDYCGILLPHTCKLNFGNMKNNYSHMWLTYINNYVDMQHN